MSAYLDTSATISVCTKYRYSLERVWDTGSTRVMIVGLNPSTADADSDDPTIRRCVGFARSNGFDGLLVTNLFAARSTSPAALLEMDDPVGPENDHWIGRLTRRATKVVIAWGNGGRLKRRDEEVLKVLAGSYCFGKTQLGAPRHPLYLARTTALQLF